MASPRHHRAPSIGELHQELEQEQEAQVNRLLQTIRHQQSQIQALQARVGTPVATGTDSPTSERSLSFSASGASNHATNPNARTRSPVPIAIRSRRPSQASPAPPHAVLAGGATQTHNTHAADESAIIASGRATPIGGGAVGPGTAGRDEAAYYQAEAQALGKENQMLKGRIRELERQLAHSRSPENLPTETDRESKMTSD